MSGQDRPDLFFLFFQVSIERRGCKRFSRPIEDQFETVSSSFCAMMVDHHVPYVQLRKRKAVGCLTAAVSSITLHDQNVRMLFNGFLLDVELFTLSPVAHPVMCDLDNMEHRSRVFFLYETFSKMLQVCRRRIHWYYFRFGP